MRRTTGVQHPVAMTSAPLPADLLTVGRTFRRQCRGRRLHPTTLRIGALRGRHEVVDTAAGTDAGMRVELLAVALDRLEPTTAVPWITRGGALSPGDLDFAWSAAARIAFGQLGLTLPAFYVVTRDGVLDLVTDEVTLWAGARKAA